jgi:multiple sugar transport system permease protein
MPRRLTISGKERTMGLNRQKIILGSVFLGLPLAWMAVFVIFPILLVVYLSFTSYDIVGTPKWIGLLNYEDLLEDDVFWTAVRNTAYYTAVTVPVGMMLSLLLALFINRQLPAIAFFRTVYYAPVVAPLVTTALVWMLFYSETIGLFNYVLSLFGIAPKQWLSSSTWAMPSVIILSIWKGVGFNMVIFLAGLQSIPRELYEAASLDGAGKVRSFWYITLPLLMPSTVYVIITSVIASFQVFEQVFVMTNGGPNNSTTTIVHQIYRTAFVHLEMGYASAMALALFVILVAASLVNVRVFARKEIYG